MSARGAQDRLRQGYEAWRGELAAEISERARAHLGALFAGELGRAGVEPGARIFEACVGAGLFHDWAAQRGHRVEGCELVDAYVERARARGHRVEHGTAIDVLAARDAHYDLIVLLDVLEHHDEREIVELMSIAAARLRPGGRLLARFPNGSSPFARAAQHGDATHCSTLTPSSVVQLGALAGLLPVWSGNAARDRTIRGPASLLKLLAFALRDAVELTLGFAYFGRRLPLDPNATVVLERPRDA